MDQMVLETQKWLNTTYKGKYGYIVSPENGETGWPTIESLTSALQIEIGIDEPTGSFGPLTESLCPTLSIGAESNLVYILQGSLWCKGYSPNGFTGYFGEGTKAAIKKLQTDAGLSNADGVVTPMIFKALLNMDAFVNVGDEKIRIIQQSLNRDYHRVIGLMPCDGRYSRQTNEALIYALQIELEIPEPTGYFGPTTKKLVPTLYPGDDNVFVRLLQYSLYCNNFDSTGFTGYFGNGTKSAVNEFQSFSALNVVNCADMPTWASLLTSTGDSDRRGNACDCATTITPEKAKTLKDNGFDFVGRYLTARYAMTPSELEDIYTAGLQVFPIFETGGFELEYFSEEQGKIDAREAITAARSLGFPVGTIIYFAVDFDAMDYQVTDAIIPYFKGINDEYTMYGPPVYRVGIYAPRNVCSRVSNIGYSCSSFVCDMSTGFSGNLGYPLPTDWTFYQISTITIGSGNGIIEVDNNIFSTKNSSLNLINSYDWPRDCLNRGWGILTEDEYYKKLSKELENDIYDSITIEMNKYGITYNPSLADHIAMANAFYNNTVYECLMGLKKYDTTKPGFMRVYEKKPNGQIILSSEYKLKRSNFTTKGFAEGLDEGLKLKYFKGIDKAFVLLGVGVSALSDLISLAEDGYVVSTEAFIAAVVTTVIKNGLVAYLAGIVSAVTSQVVLPELPVIAAVFGGVAGAVFGYAISQYLSEEELLEYLTEKLTWLLEILTTDFSNQYDSVNKIELCY